MSCEKGSVCTQSLPRELLQIFHLRLQDFLVCSLKTEICSSLRPHPEHISHQHLPSPTSTVLTDTSTSSPLAADISSVTCSPTWSEPPKGFYVVCVAFLYMHGEISQIIPVPYVCFLCWLWWQLQNSLLLSKAVMCAQDKSLPCSHVGL